MRAVTDRPGAEQAAGNCIASTRELKLTPTRPTARGCGDFNLLRRPELVSPTPVHSHSWHPASCVASCDRWRAVFSVSSPCQWASLQ
jgi:hypothetical protein